jgi:hypothetical protein
MILLIITAHGIVYRQTHTASALIHLKKIFTHGNLLTGKIGWFIRIEINKQPIDNKEQSQELPHKTAAPQQEGTSPARLQF